MESARRNVTKYILFDWRQCGSQPEYFSTSASELKKGDIAGETGSAARKGSSESLDGSAGKMPAARFASIAPTIFFNALSCAGFNASGCDGRMCSRAYGSRSEIWGAISTRDRKSVLRV